MIFNAHGHTSLQFMEPIHYIPVGLDSPMRFHKLKVIETAQPA